MYILKLGFQTICCYSVAKYGPKQGSLLDRGVASFRVEQQSIQHLYDHPW